MNNQSDLSLQNKRFSFRNDSVKVIAISLVYFLAHQIAFFFPDSGDVIMLIWPAGGVGLAAFLLFPRRLWPALVIAFYIAGVSASVLFAGRSFITGFGYMTANMVESVGCAWLILFFSKSFQKFNRVQEVLALIAGMLIVNAFSTCIGTGTSVLTRGAIFTEVWLSWFISDGLGIVLVAPFIVAWFGNSKDLLNGLNSKKIIEGLACIIIWSALSILIFYPSFFRLGMDVYPYYLVGLLVWPAIRFGQKGVTLALLVLFLIAFVSPTIEYGPSPWTARFKTDDLSYRLIELQIFLGFLAIVGYLMAAGYDTLIRFENVLKQTNKKLLVAKEEIEKSEAKFRGIFENIQDVYYESSLDGIIIEISPSIEMLSKGQYHRNDIIGMPIQDFYYNANDRQVVLSIIHEKGSVSDYEVVVKNRDGSKISCSISSKIQFNANGKPEKIIGTIRDIAGRKQIEETIEKDRSLLRTLVDNLPIAVFVKDKNFRKTLTNALHESGVNGHLASLKLKTVDEFLGKTDFDCYPKEFAEKYYEIDKMIIVDGQSIINKLEEGFDINGSPIWNLVSKIPLKDKNGEINGMIGITTDITEYRRAEEELKKAKEKAEESDRLKTAFLQNMSHEIRTPMNAIIGFSELLVRNFDNKPKLEKFTETIIQRCNDLLDIINDILDIAKIESGQLPVNIEECNINTVYSEIYALFRIQQKRQNKSNINFKVQLVDEQNPILTYTDKVKLKQILINLISNAFKFTNEGTIEAGYKIDNNNLVFFVSDSGIGIPLEKHKTVFERFAQVDLGLSRVYGGTGLGLSIVRGLLDLLGGKIWLESLPGKGSTFFFTIPYTPIHRMQTSQTVIDIDGDFHFTGKTILIVEDDDYNADYLREVLSETGINILQSKSGKEALQIALSEKINLVLLDIRLPDTNGYEVARSIRQTNPNLKVIAQTAYASQDEKQKAIDAGCSDYLSKPIQGKILLSMVAKYLNDEY